MGLTLHKEKGVNPRMTECPVCGKEGDSLVLVGDKDYKITCKECGLVAYGGWDKRKCPACGSYDGDKEKLGEFEKVKMVCEECRNKQNAEHKKAQEAVEGGGVYFRCLECGGQGAIKKNEYTDMVRKVHGDEFCEPVDGKYKPCGIEFATCSEHGGN